MNDPGLDDPIAQDAQMVDGHDSESDGAEKEEEQAFLTPSRWWFASTAFPLAAGTFGPMASAFSICALVVHWRVWIPPGGVEEHGIYIKDPKWLIAINAVQLVIALIANLFLLLNMARRVRFTIAQPITIVGWYISSFALIGLTATAAGPLKLASPPDHAFTQAFYYAIFSAGLYFIVASLMVITVIGAQKGFYEQEFKLSMSQRTLMLQTISFLVYLLVGASVFAHTEKWQYLDAVYWADFTLLTVGIGDYGPTTHLGRGLVMPYAIGGIIILGLVIGSIRGLVLERGKMKMDARMVEKERRRLVKKMEKKDLDLLVPVKDEKPSGLTERKRRYKEFMLMRRAQKMAKVKRQWLSLLISGGVWLGLWFIGAAVFEATEHGQDWSYYESMYFAYTSLLTIGYGDFYPQSNSGKPFFVFWSLLAIPSLTVLISNMGDTIVKGIRDLTLWIGNFTVLPAEEGFKQGLKQGVDKVNKGVFGDVDENPPGFLGEAQQRKEKVTLKYDPESSAQAEQDTEAARETKLAETRGKTNDEEAIPDNPHQYHCLLIEEINNVMGHLHSNPPRKYTFDEWSWYLKLMGEDESDPQTHRRPIENPTPDGDGLQTAMQEKRAAWSWMGNRSPLMGDKEEAQWVLDRLVGKLRMELAHIKEEKHNQKHEI